MKLRRIDLSDGQEDTNTSLIEMMKTIQDLRRGLSNETGTLKRTQAERKIKLKHPATQLENPKEHLKSR